MSALVEHVRIHGDRLDPMTARLRLEHLLAGVDLRPGGLPNGALLYVRELADPLPGSLHLAAPGAPVPLRWERALQDALEVALRDAARPARESVPAGARAVLFADQAEVLACLARDAVDGVAWTRWWWRRILARTRTHDSAVLSAWLEAPEHVPAALELLATTGEHVRFVASLAPGPARLLAIRVASAFSAPALAAAAETQSPAMFEMRRARRRDAPGRGIGAPWDELVPEGTSAPFPEGRLLLGVALALRRRPALARSPAFARAVAGWRAQVTRDLTEAEAAALASALVQQQTARTDRRSRHGRGSAPIAAAVSQPPDLQARVVPLQVDVPAPSQPRADDQRPAEVPDRSEPVLERRPADPLSSSPAPAADGRVRAPTPAPPSALTVAEEIAAAEPTRADLGVSIGAGPKRSVAAGRSRPQRSTMQLDAAAAKAPVAPAAHKPDSQPLSRLQVPSTVQTQLGGIFYLLNLAVFLDLYGDFTTPLRPGIALDPFDYLTLLGTNLLGRRPPDPIWTLLAQLAGREPRAGQGAGLRPPPPGAGFRPPRAWRVAPEWLAPFEGDDRPWLWSASDGSLRIMHPDGFPAVAVPRTDGPPATQLKRELLRLRSSITRSGGSGLMLASRMRRAPLPPEPRAPLARWVSRLAAYADRRLRLALGLGYESDLADLLLRRPARVLVTYTHLEVVLRLHELPLAVRFAGLDRTPGWVPAAGRYVSLEFE